MPYDESLRKKWVEAGYQSDMGSACVLPPPPSDFIAAYHFAPAEFAVSDIALSRLKVAKFSDLNDPFELMAAKFAKSTIRDTVTNFRDAQHADTGLLCFSQDWISPVLWSHYAAKHTGICLGFHAARASIKEVRYESERIISELGKTDEPFQLSEELKQQLLCTKYSHWSYEEELRRFILLDQAIKEGALYFYPFDDSLKLVEVILGVNCRLSLDAVRMLVTALHRGVRVYCARLAINYFAVVPKEDTLNW